MKKSIRLCYYLSILVLLFGAIGCDEIPTESQPVDPAIAPVVSIDRFSDDAGTYFRRSSNPDLPGPNEPIDFDRPPFLSKGLGPNGEIVQYYNFDVMPTDPVPIYVLFREGENTPVEGQLNILDVIPGQDEYSDFWQVYRVTVSPNYKANTITSLNQINSEGYKIEAMDRIVNCPVVPEGSSANNHFMRTEDNELDRGWYRGRIVHYFTFSEKPYTINSNNKVSTSQIYVSFRANPGYRGWGLPSGFKTENGNRQTHNVFATLPSDNDYSPLRSVTIYDNYDFTQVSDLATARDANILAEGATTMNFPVVNVKLP